MAKLAFIGTHGVGKTTLCFELAACLKRLDLSVDIVKEVARACPLPINRDTTIAAQSWILHSQVAREIEVASRYEAIGSFMSRYSRQNLARLSEERAARWAVDPPLVRRTLAREDQYRSEGAAHVRARNAAWDAGDIHTAWRKNLILERYYAPVIDTPSHI